MSEISSGLVAVAWQVRNGWSSCDLYRTLKSATEDRDMLQKRADFAGNLMAYRVEPLVRLSDAEAKLSECVTSYEKEVAGLTAELNAKDEEIERLDGECNRLAKAASKNYRDNGLPINEEFYKQAERIKELESDVDEEAHIRDRMAKLLAETAVALKGPEKALHRHGWQDLPDVAAKQSAALKLARQALTSITEKPRAYEGIRMASQALAAIDALKGE